MATGLTESQIETLLREAEERLAAKQLVDGKPATSKAVHVALAKAAAPKVLPEAIAASKAAEAGPASSQAAATKDNLSIRVPHAQKPKDKKQPDNAGPDWFGLPKTVLTPEAKRDFQILRMRGILDPKQHFRKDGRKDPYPKFSAFGTIVEGAMEGERGRLTRKERKRTIVEEVLASREANDNYKKRYLKIQEKKASGKKGFYKKLSAQRRRRP